jgi:hypothetical protein
MMGMKIMAMVQQKTHNNGGIIISDARMGTAGNNSIKGKEVNAPKAQMDIDFSEDDLLGKEIL